MIHRLQTLSFSSVFTGLLFFVVALSSVAPRAASFAAPVAGLILLAVWYAQRRQFMKLSCVEVAFMLGFPALAAVSALWAIDPAFAVERALKLAPLLLFGLFFIEAARRAGEDGLTPRAVCFLFILYALIAAGVALEIFWDLKIYRFVNAIPDAQAVSIVMMNRSMVVLTAFHLPLLLLLYKTSLPRGQKIFLAAAATIALLAGLVQTESQSAQLYFMLSLVLLAVFPARWRAAWVMTGIGVCIMAFSAPWLAQFLFHAVPNDPAMAKEGLMKAASIPHRLEVWNFVAGEIMKHPWIGQGIEAVRYIKSETWLVLPQANNMLHPHNAPLQLWVEFGVIGISAGCALFLYILTRLWKAPDPGRRAGFAASISMLAVMSTGYGLWQSWQIGLLLALCGLFAVAIRQNKGFKP